MEDFFADRFQGAQIGIEQDDADTAVVGEVAQYIDKTQVRKHRKDANLPCVFDNLGGAPPAEHVELVRVNFNEKEGLAGSVRSQKLFVKPGFEKSGWIDNVL